MQALRIEERVVNGERGRAASDAIPADRDARMKRLLVTQGAFGSLERASSDLRASEAKVHTSGSGIGVGAFDDSGKRSSVSSRFQQALLSDKCMSIDGMDSDMDDGVEDFMERVSSTPRFLDNIDDHKIVPVARRRRRPNTGIPLERLPSRSGSKKGDLLSRDCLINLLDCQPYPGSFMSQGSETNSWERSASPPESDFLFDGVFDEDDFVKNDDKIPIAKSCQTNNDDDKNPWWRFQKKPFGFRGKRLLHREEENIPVLQ